MNIPVNTQKECGDSKETRRKNHGKRIGLVLTGTFMILCLSLAFNAVFHFLPDSAESMIILIVGIIIAAGYLLKIIIDAMNAAAFINAIFKRKL